MGQFRVSARLAGPTGRREETDLLVDTGSTLVALPRALAERLELVTERQARVMVAGGRRATVPVAEVRVTLSQGEVTTKCFIVSDGPALLGAVVLETLLLAVDPVRKRLVRTDGLLI